MKPIPAEPWEGATVLTIKPAPGDEENVYSCPAIVDRNDKTINVLLEVTDEDLRQIEKSRGVWLSFHGQITPFSAQPAEVDGAGSGDGAVVDTAGAIGIPLQSSSGPMLDDEDWDYMPPKGIVRTKDPTLDKLNGGFAEHADYDDGEVNRDATS